MTKKKDLTGQRFGRLQVIKEVQDSRRGVYWLCKCDCGNDKIAKGIEIRRGNIQSCGCMRGPLRGLMHSPFCKIYLGMMRRCYDKNRSNYKNYGGRGIGVYEEWRGNPKAFIEWMEANLGPKPSPNHTLDRIDNDGDYAPGNLRWATKAEQVRNRRVTKLNEDDVRRIRDLYKQGMRKIDIWRTHYSYLSEANVRKIIDYDIWKDVI